MFVNLNWLFSPWYSTHIKKVANKMLYLLLSDDFIFENWRMCDKYNRDEDLFECIV